MVKERKKEGESELRPGSIESDNMNACRPEHVRGTRNDAPAMAPRKRTGACITVYPHPKSAAEGARRRNDEDLTAAASN